MTPEQKAVVLDYATELQSNDEPWREYEWLNNRGIWVKCSEQFNPCRMLPCEADKDPKFRRKPKTITVTIPRPHATEKNCYLNGTFGFAGHYDDEEMADKALAAIREAISSESVNT